jgi:Fe(3+) dicitrate transport protein
MLALALPAAAEEPSAEAAPVEAAPVEAAPVEAAPVEAAPVEAAPVEAAPVEAAPVEAAAAVTRAPERMESVPATPPGGAARIEHDAATVFGGRDASRISGSAHLVKEKQLEQFEYDDIQRVLKGVPGVYVREEDGFGLRPNIGLRGASSDRSAKVTLLEDGVLLAPAPYAAPAAYYFPMTQRLAGVEVYKGPSSIEYGPNTVGGAVNLLTRRIPSASLGALDLAAGSYGYGKTHGWWGTGGERGGVLFEGVRLHSDGFRQLDGGGPTGFDRTELMFKGKLQTDPKALVFQRLELKLGWSDETSHETYLGLSDADLRETPLRRYAASQRDLMTSWRSQLQLSHVLSVGDTFELRTVAYRHDQHRIWRRLNGFRGADIADVLGDPSGARRVFLAVLQGREDAQGGDDTLLLATNDRWFVSQGLQVTGRWTPRLAGLKHAIDFGARLHSDRIRRRHTEDGYLMRGVAMLGDGAPSELVALNTGEALAGAFHLRDELLLGPVLVTPGARVELIQTRFVNDLAGAGPTGAFHPIVIPGIGAAWALLPELTLLAGVHRGFSPVSPGQDPAVQPETSLNAEAGGRWSSDAYSAELIGFFNRYENLTGECTFSGGCPEDRVNAQYNGGRVNVYGLEAAAGARVKLPARLRLQVDLAYTLTLSEFLTGFTSENPLFGTVRPGDALAYVPVHQAALVAALSGPGWNVAASATWVGAMRDRPGQGEFAPGDGTDDQLILDVTGGYEVSDAGQLYLKLDNATNAAAVASRRPFGARPNAPLQLVAGYKHSFGE